ncbi:MAG: tetratricopeptide repeat protein [Candidatus Omnitrophota bacterium]|nr:MAG: tetratricopeptide repeat protein [Candidatus Omnitrophota bacterium]
MRKNYIHFLLIVILGIGVYINSLKGEFIWDDESLVKNNVYIKSFSYLPEIFTTHLRAGAGKKGGFWRPLQALSYLFNYSLFRLNVTGYHLTNVVLHIGVALMLYWLAMLLFGDRIISFFSSLFFVIHPIHTEAVSYISGRADSLAALFMLLCFVFYIKCLDKKNIMFFFSMLVGGVLAFLSRENTLILPILLLLYHYTFRRKVNIFHFFSVVGITIFYIGLRLTLLKPLLDYQTTVLAPSTFLERIPGFFVALTSYLKLLVAPFPLHMEYGNTLFAFTDIRAIIGVIIFLCLCACAYRFRKNTLIFFSILWFFIMLLPQSNLYPINAYMAEHWLYLASIGFFLVVGKALSACRIKKIQLSTAILATILVGVYGAITIKQNTYWRKPLGFYERTLKYAPFSMRVHNNLAIIYHLMERHQEAVSLYKKAIEMDPSFAETYNNLGLLYHDLKKYEDAFGSYTKAIEVDPDYGEPHSNLCLLYTDIGKHQEAVASCNRALGINPNLVNAHNNLGNAYQALGKIDEALASYKKAVVIDPDYAKAYYNLGVAYDGLGKYKDATVVYKIAIAKDPNYAKAYNNLGNVYRMLGQYEEAIPLYKKAIEVNPQDGYAYSNLGSVYARMGKAEDAIVFYKKAIEFNPSHPDMHYNLGSVYSSLDNYHEAIVAYNKALKFNPNHALAHNNIAVAYYHIGEYDLALKHYKRAVEFGLKVNPDLLKAIKSRRRRRR